MSHVTDVRMRVKDLDALDEACDALGLELRRGQTRYAWWGTFVGDSSAYGQHDPATFGKCEHAIGRKGMRARTGPDGEYEIGVVPALDGDGYDLLYDAYGPGRRLTEIVGEGVNTLRREYACAAVTRKAKQKLAPKGWQVARENLPNGRIRVKLRKR